ncbi:MAG TPA: heat-inducible transcriptional repressor HrcA [Alphaproteobacteria bacterium]|nr:heat-inducible transcriptional repressor HrcA [Alphaproteobacteria bacterium]HNS44757.1 heat-inducible transcriptional repressor HrcA [Alphaproteobacteria bacterium]
MDDRAKNIFRLIVEEYLEHGTPVGSKTLQSAGVELSPATIRNVMARLEEEELLFAPHISAGRQPTEKGLRLFVDNLMTVNALPLNQRKAIESQLASSAKSISGIFEGTSSLLSGLSSCVGMVIAPKTNKPVKQIQFLALEPHRVLTVLILQDGQVENRIIHTDKPIPQFELDRLTNYLNEQIAGKTLPEFEGQLKAETIQKELQLKGLTQNLIDKGIIHPLSSLEEGHIFIQGQAKLFEDPTAQQKLDEIRRLMTFLDEKKNMLQIMSAIENGEGVQIFIGSENPILQHPGWSTIIKGYHDQNGRVIGATGIIGPTRLNYGQIVQIVDYTTLFMERILGIHVQ